MARYVAWAVLAIVLGWSVGSAGAAGQAIGPVDEGGASGSLVVAAQGGYFQVVLLTNNGTINLRRFAFSEYQQMQAYIARLQQRGLNVSFLIVDPRF